MARPTKAQRETTLRKQILKYLSALDRGKEGYKEADAVLDLILADVKPGARIDLGGGQTAEIVDNFAGKNKHFKPCGVSRFEVKVSRA